MKVCRTWYSRISPVYYEELEVFFSDKKLLRLTEMTRIDGKKIGDFTRYIEFSHIYDFQKAEFCRLLQNLPYLHTIHFTNADECVGFLASVPPKQLLQNVQEVTGHTDDKEMQKTMLSINIRLNDRITRLFLDNLDTDIRINGYNSLFAALSSFTKLTELSISAQKGQEACLQQILKTCKHIKTLRFSSDHGFTITEENYETHRQLKTLSLSALSGLLFENVDYIMDHLPSLKELKLALYCQQEVSVFDLSSERFKKFVHYLKRLSKFSLQDYRIYTVDKPTYCIRDKRFWSYIQELVGENYSCNLNIHVSHFGGFRSLEVKGNTIEKMIDIDNCWIDDSDLSREPWIHFIHFLSLKSATVFQYEAPVYNANQRTLLIEPLIKC